MHTTGSLPAYWTVEGRGADRRNKPALLPDIVSRVASRRAIGLLGRNTAVSVVTFLFGLALMWTLLELTEASQVFAAGLSFLAATSLHYLFGRAWIFTATQRAVGAGCGFFLVNALIGLILTVSLFAALTSWTGVNYLVARVIVSAFAGVVMFALNALLNFKQL